jgi:hypothetical protein
VLLRSNADYNLKILLNRIRLLMAAKNRTAFKFSEFLPSLYKILQEEFLKQNQLDLRSRFHEHEIKKAIRATTPPDDAQPAPADQQEEPVSLDEHLLEEVEAKHAF